jgi:hypothetical protein
LGADVRHQDRHPLQATEPEQLGGVQDADWLEVQFGLIARVGLEKDIRIQNTSAG